MNANESSKLNVSVLIDLYKITMQENGRSSHGFVACQAGMGVHIREDRLEDVAPLSEWNLNQKRNSEDYPFEHSIVVEGVTFFVISVKPIEIPEPTRCHYCGHIRPIDELKIAKIYHNGGQEEHLYCVDKQCAVYAEMSGEG